MGNRTSVDKWFGTYPRQRESGKSPACGKSEPILNEAIMIECGSNNSTFWRCRWLLGAIAVVAFVAYRPADLTFHRKTHLFGREPACSEF